MVRPVTMGPSPSVNSVVSFRPSDRVFMSVHPFVSITDPARRLFRNTLRLALQASGLRCIMVSADSE
jgi:hypothetical protein